MDPEQSRMRFGDSPPAIGAPSFPNSAADDTGGAFSPAATDAAGRESGNGGAPLFPATTDDAVHVPPSDRQLFASAPAHGKYLTFIQRIMTGGDCSTFLTSAFAAELCGDALIVLRSEPSLLDVDISGGSESANSKLVVVGDVHGQFADLVAHVFAPQYERPVSGAENDHRFLFLGDFVDRGPQGVEVIMLLLALKVEWPSNIYLLRGNHEEAQTSRVYGFLQEVRQKFNDVAVWARFNEVFCFFPLAAVVHGDGHRFLALHGGLSPGLFELDAIATLDRVDYGGTLDTSSSDIVDGILWSDPTESVPRFSRNDRGCGFTFGPAATADFCARNQLDFICRAHQMTMAGYTWAHEGKCLTLFSAPNYCGLSGNLAAIMIVDGVCWDIQFVQFQATTVRSSPTARPPAQYFS